MMAANLAGGRWAGLQRKGMDPDFHRIQWEFWRMGRRGPEGYPGAPETEGESCGFFLLSFVGMRHWETLWVPAQFNWFS